MKSFTSIISVNISGPTSMFTGEEEQDKSWIISPGLFTKWEPQQRPFNPVHPSTMHYLLYSYNFKKMH
jgi:hypothetical protein